MILFKQIGRISASAANIILAVSFLCIALAFVLPRAFRPWMIGVAVWLAVSSLLLRLLRPSHVTVVPTSAEIDMLGVQLRLLVPPDTASTKVEDLKMQRKPGFRQPLP